MGSTRTAQRYSALVGGTALIALGVLGVGCSRGADVNTPTTNTTTTPTKATSTTGPAITPTEKGLIPTGGYSFAPQDVAPPALTVDPDVHRHRGGHHG
jgi:hypothetical protein